MKWYGKVVNLTEVGLKANLQNTPNLPQIPDAKKIEMHQQIIQLVNGQPFFKPWFGGVGFFVGVVKNIIETTEQTAHGKITFAVRKTRCRIKKHRFAEHIAKHVAVPKIAVDEGWWFLRTEAWQLPANKFHTLHIVVGE